MHGMDQYTGWQAAVNPATVFQEQGQPCAPARASPAQLIKNCEAAQAWGVLEDGAREALAAAAVLVPQVEAAAAREADSAIEAEAAARCAVYACRVMSMLHRLACVCKCR